MAELKPCKWCEIVDDTIGEGKIKKISGNYFIAYCKRCGWFTDAFSTEQQAIDAWNKRS